MKRLGFVILAVLALPLNGCLTAYRLGYNKASDECIEAVNEGAQIVKGNIEAQRKLDRLELETCRDTLAACDCK